MTRETGTLQELNVQPGDVVQNYARPVMNGGVWIVKNIKGDQFLGVKGEYGPYHKGVPLSGSYIWRIVSRASDAPKLWRDMTPEEKGALLLAHHEGKVIEAADVMSKYDTWKKCWNVGKFEDFSYRIRPEPKRETFTIWIYPDGDRGTKIGTIDAIDGVLDRASIRLETADAGQDT